MGGIRKWGRMFQTEGRVLCISIRARETTDKVILSGQNKNVGMVEVARG